MSECIRCHIERTAPSVLELVDHVLHTEIPEVVPELEVYMARSRFYGTPRDVLEIGNVNAVLLCPTNPKDLHETLRELAVAVTNLLCAVIYVGGGVERGWFDDELRNVRDVVTRIKERTCPVA